MSVKNMLPIIGVGSAFAILGLAAARRQTSARRMASSPPTGGLKSPQPASAGQQPARARAGDARRPSGIHARVEPGAEAAPSAMPVELTSDFWDVAPESPASRSDVDELRAGLDDPARPAVALEGYDEPSVAGDAFDRDGLTADWLARATEAPAWDEATDEDRDDPAEIPADSISMISDASRHAAAFDLGDAEEREDEGR